MAIACFDSSAFVKLLVDEDGSEVATRMWDDATAAVASRLAYPEVRAALAAARRAARLGAAAERRARSELDDYWAEVDVVELTGAVASAAAELTAEHVLGGADAVHLASALTLADTGPVVVAWDARLRAAALDAGLRVAPASI